MISPTIRPGRGTGKAVAVAMAVTALAATPAVASRAATRQAVASPARAAATTRPGGAVTLKPFFHRMPAKHLGGARAVAGAAAAVPLRTLTSSFTSGGRTFPYTMVGTAPGGAAVTTTLPNTLTPVSLRFGAQTLAVPATSLNNTRNSGIWINKAFPGETGQYVDVFMRTQFWSQLNNGAKAWHVKLAAATVRPTLTLTVPPGSGRVVSIAGVTTGFADINWLDNAIQGYVTAPDASIFTQLLTNNIVLCDGAPAVDLSNCGIGGYHSMTSTATGRHTYAYNSYLNRLIFNDPTFANIAILTHEVAEWAADPYVNNVTPNWTSPIAPQYGCSSFLEVGDPVVGKGITIGGLFYQDEVYLNWFARRATSNAWLGRRTWMNSLTALSVPCTPIP